jgi:hypothetical protein
MMVAYFHDWFEPKLETYDAYTKHGRGLRREVRLFSF